MISGNEIKLQYHCQILKYLCLSGIIDYSLYNALSSQISHIRISSGEDVQNFLNLVYYYKYCIPLDLSNNDTLQNITLQTLLLENDLLNYNQSINTQMDLRIMAFSLFPKVIFI